MTKELIIKKAERMISQLEGREVSLNWQYKDRKVLMEELQRAVCDSFDLTWEQICAKRRTRKRVLARHLFSYIGNIELRYQTVTLAKSLNRDHTTVIHARETIRDMISTNNPEVMDALQRVRAMI